VQRGIDSEIALVRRKENRGALVQFAEGKGDIDEVLECYRRIQGHLERLAVSIVLLNIYFILTMIQLNTNLKNLKIADELATVRQNNWSAQHAERYHPFQGASSR
jgi:hypothetical protein